MTEAQTSLTPGKDSKPPSERQLFQSVLTLSGRRPGLLVAIVLLGVTSSIFEGISIYLFIPLLQVVSAGGSQDPGRMFGIEIPALRSIAIDLQVPVIAGLIVLTLALKNLLAYGDAVLMDWTNSRFAHELRVRVNDILLRANYAFLERQELGRVQSILLNEVWRVTSAFTAVLTSIVTVCYIVVLAAVLFFISVKLTILVTILLAGFLALTHLITKTVAQYGVRAVEVNASLMATAWETFAGLFAVRDFGREDYEHARFQLRSDNVAQVFYRLGRISSSAGPLFETLAALLLASLLVFSKNWGLSFPQLTAYVLLLYRLQPRAQQVASARVSLLGFRSSVEQVKELLELAAEAEAPSGSRAFPGLRDGIQLKDVSFCYPTRDAAALSNVDLTFPRGTMTAIVGPSGAGKSTLVGLLCRYYQPDMGEVEIDGRPLTEYDLASWRDRVAVVRQENFLFATSVAENIAYGRQGATRDAVIAAAKLAHAHDFIEELPDGYDTDVGERGRRLSGGQRQRLALARALVRQPDILILDEATNELDSLAEQAIQKAIEEIRRTCTVIVIAHRLSTIASAEQVVVLDAGRIVQLGPFATLSKVRGVFRRMLKAQYFEGFVPSEDIDREPVG